MDLLHKLKGKYHHAKSKAEQLHQHPIFNNTPPGSPIGTTSINPSITQDPTSPTAINQTLYQAFEWYTPSDPHSPTENYWHILRTRLPYLASLGITEIHLPPGCKAGNPQGNGYDIYDLWDLGEFDWKDQRPTKWGPKEALVALCQDAMQHGIGMVWDAVLNHRFSADHAETVQAVQVDETDRTKDVGEPRQIVAWTGFDFPAREGRYSGLKLRKRHFNAIDWDDGRKERAIFRFCEGDGCGWAEDVDLELGNSDYLLGTNLAYSPNPDLREDVIKWGLWIVHELGLTGFRLDAMKHMSQAFVLKFMTRLQQEVGPNLSFIGEYWKWDSQFLANMAAKMQGRCRFYDTQLFYNFSDFSLGKKNDLRQLLEGSLVEIDPSHAVTVVGTHDTQPTQALAIPFPPWFLPHAHCTTLLRASPSLPCIFHGHLYGTSGPERQPPLPWLPVLIYIRRYLAYGAQYSYLFSSECTGWTRTGRQQRSQAGGNDPDGCAVLLSSARGPMACRMFVGQANAKCVFRNVLVPGEQEEVRTDENGEGIFSVQSRSAAVWIRAEALDDLQVRTDSQWC